MNEGKSKDKNSYLCEYECVVCVYIYLYLIYFTKGSL